MNPEAPGAGENLTARDAELDAMRRMLVASEGCFSLSIAVCGAFLRDQIVKQLQSHDGGIESVEVPRETVDVYGAVTSKLKERTPSALFVVGLENSVDPEARDHAAIRSVNASRELWERRFPCPVVFWIPSGVATLLSAHAPDFWRYASHHFEFLLEEASGDARSFGTFGGDIVVASLLHAEAKQLRMAELKDRLSEVADQRHQIPAMHTLIWLNELALLHYFVGELDEAEKLIREALKIEERLGRQEGMASDYGNLGLVLQARGDLDGAEKLHRKALAIEKQLGNLEGMAIDYGNLGNVLETRGDLDGAEAMHRKALEINEKLGRLEGMAIQYGNLGNILRTRGDLDGAVAMYRQSLEIADQLGLLEGKARSYGNLGIVLLTRGDLEGAEKMYRQALEIFEQLGRLEGMASQYGNLGTVLAIRSDPDGAEAMHRQALKIQEKLGLLDGMANSYGNLGILSKKHGDNDKARGYLEKSLEVFTRIGAKPQIEKTQQLLDGLDGGASG